MATHSSILAWKTPWKRTPVSAVLPPGDLLDPGIKPVSLMSPALAGGFFITSATWELRINFLLFSKENLFDKIMNNY